MSSVKLVRDSGDNDEDSPRRERQDHEVVGWDLLQ